MDMTPLISSHIIATGYDEASNTLRIQFKNGTYDYANVPKEVYEAFLKAPSHGKYHMKNIRGQYTFEKIKIADNEEKAEHRDVHITPHQDGGWQIKIAGNEQAFRVVDTQQLAIRIGRARAKLERAELVIHGKDGRIRQKDSYGNDPYPPKG